MDKFEALAAESSIAVAILGNADVTDVELLPVCPNPISENVHELSAKWAHRGLRFIGVAGLVAGRPRWALATPLDEVRAEALGAAFATYCETLLPGHVAEQRKGDEVEWLRRLWSLPDMRVN